MAVAVGTRGPLGGLPPSLSDFGVVNATSCFGYEDGEPVWSDGESFWNRNTSTAANSGVFLSPELQVPNVAADIDSGSGLGGRLKASTPAVLIS